MIEKKKKKKKPTTTPTYSYYSYCVNWTNQKTQNIYFQSYLVIVSYFIILFQPIRNWHLNNCKNIMKFIMSV